MIFMKNEIFPTSNIKFKKGFFRVFKKRTSSTIIGDSGFVDEFPVDNDISEHDDIDDNFIGSSVNKKNLTIFLSLALTLIVFLFIRSGYLQLIMGEYYLGIADGNRIRTDTIMAKRGIIYDRNKRQLVYNRPNFFLVVNPREFFLNKKNEDYKICINDDVFCRNSKIKIILELFDNTEKGVSSEYISDIFNNINIRSVAPHILVEKIGYQDALYLINKTRHMSGLSVDLDNTREYLPTDSMSHWIGYTGRISQDELSGLNNSGYGLNDYIGKTGLEKYYEGVLRGVDGSRDVEINALGKRGDIVDFVEPISGKNLILSIDYDLQKKSEEIFKKHLKDKGKNKGAVIILDVNNGNVLSMISAPDFSVNDFSYKIDPEKYNKLISNVDKPLFNRAVMGEYPSGSIIKPVIGAAALEEEIISPWNIFYSKGGISVGSWFFPDWKPGGHGRTNLRKAIAESVNTFFYIIVGGYENFDGLGLEKFKEYGEKFGLNSATGIDLPFEESGFIPTKEWKKDFKGEQWYIGDTYHVSIGQGDLLITPLQSAVFTSIIANGGKFYRPHFITRIEDENGVLVKGYDAEIVGSNIVSSKNLGTISRGMRDCVTYGSCVFLNDLPFSVAGKTGTAQHIRGKDPHSWFIGFAPFEKPEIAISVLVEEGEGGTKIAVPVAKEILKWYLGKK